MQELRNDHRRLMEKVEAFKLDMFKEFAALHEDVALLKQSAIKWGMLSGMAGSVLVGVITGFLLKLLG